MLAHAAHILRPALQPAQRQQNPSVLRTTLIVVGAAVTGTLLYRWFDGDDTPAAKGEWIYWAEQASDGYWYPWVQRPDGRRIKQDDDPWLNREYAEDAARDEVLRQGGIPVLSYAAPGTEDAGAGLEGAGPGAPKKNYVGTGWFWPHQDLFPNEASILRFLDRLGYATAGSEALSAQNMEAAKRFQADYNIVVRYLETGTSIDSAWPLGLVADGLLGAGSLQGLSVVYLLLDQEDTLAEWRQAVADGKKFAAIPTAVKQILRLGYGNFSKWMKTNATGRRAMVRPFQDDYNCVFKNTGRPMLTVDGQVGPQTKTAAGYATALVESFDTTWDQYVAAC